MTVFSFKDAAILSYLSHSKRLSSEDRSQLISGLSKKAAKLAHTLPQSGSVSKAHSTKRMAAKK